jgi:hypothetical protein
MVDHLNTKGGKTMVKPISNAVFDPGKDGLAGSAILKQVPRDVPLSFGYIFVSKDNPYADMYRKMLQAENLARIYEDIPSYTVGRPNFDIMVDQLRPNDTVVLVRLNQLSALPRVILTMTRRLAEANINIRLISKAARATTQSSALVLNLLSHIDELNPVWLVGEGGDGGSGNGGY